MAFHFHSVIANFLTRPFNNKTKKSKKTNAASTKKNKCTNTAVDQPVSPSLNSSSSTSTAMIHEQRRPTDDDNEPPLPYSQYVTLSKEETKFHCQRRIMAHEVKYSMVTTIIQSWERDLKTIPNWDGIGGELLLRKMFELEPDCVRMFGFPLDTKFDDPALSTNPKFMKKAIALIVAVDIALSLLGPDLEVLESELVELGTRHVARQCKPKHWPMVGVALFHTLEQALGTKFTVEIQECWVILYNFLGYHMIQGLIQNGGPTWEDN